ncbi:nuclear transport factor 2 family protein [Nocardia sp. NPDC059240]|uniref:nuclear transport factor 2 family protein n=1 Tax=Nocardia sp. NPDC059240 TaxID=3346786 RepID=UPI00368D709F
MSEPEQFVAKFIDFWKNPSTQRLPEILHPDVVLTQPLAAPMRGIGAAQEEFERIWRFLPDLRAHVDLWRGDSEVLFIEFRLRATVGREQIEWPNIDRFMLREGKAFVRTNYFDPLPIFGKIVKHPSLWRRWWTSGASRPWRTGHGIDDYTALVTGA